jgi:hypothetical protein
MAKILHTIYNISPTLSAVVNSFTFVTDPAIRHSADLAAFAGLTDNYTGATTLITLSTNYVTGGLSRKPFASATFPVTQTITGHDGTTLIVDSTAALTDKIGWQGNGVYLGRYIVSITSATYLLMSNTPSSAPTIPSTITFSTSTNELTLSGTTPTLGMAAGWKILGNGYNSTGTVISVKNSFTLIVDNLPDTTPTVGNPMTFRAPGTDGSKTVTVASSAGLSNGFIASGNGFTIGQSITNVSGNVLTMSAEPNGTPEFGGSISFVNNNATLYTIPPSGSVSFNLDYSYISGGIGTYASILTVKVTQSTQRSLVVRNYVGISAAPVVPPPVTYTGNYGGGGGGRGGDSGFGSAPAPSVGHRGFDGNQSISGSQNGSFGSTSSAGSDGGGGDGGGGDGGGGGSSPGCFLADAKITLANGTIKELIELRPGDLVLGAFGEINPVIGIYYQPLGNTPMYKINDDHDCTDDEVFVTTDREFYCINSAVDGSYNSHDGWGESYRIDLENGISEMLIPPWSLGLISRPLHKVELGIKLQTTSGERILDSYVPYQLPPETVVYNCVVGGSHTLMINGYAHTAWARDDDFDYDQWKPRETKGKII